MESRCEATIGKESFDNLKKRTITIVGAGGTGATVINLLARLPFKKIILIDSDIVEESNLERQLLFFKADLGKTKVDAIKEKLSGFCPIDYVFKRVGESNVDMIRADIVIDCTDNLDSRRVINNYCQKHNIPWIFSGVLKNIGQVYFVKPGDSTISKIINKEDINCKDPGVGVINSAVSVIASWAASLAFNYLTQGKIEEKLIRLDLNSNTILKLKL